MDFDRDPDQNPFDLEEKKNLEGFCMYRLLISHGELIPFYYNHTVVWKILYLKYLFLMGSGYELGPGSGSSSYGV